MIDLDIKKKKKGMKTNIFIPGIQSGGGDTHLIIKTHE